MTQVAEMAQPLESLRVNGINHPSQDDWVSIYHSFPNLYQKHQLLLLFGESGIGAPVSDVINLFDVVASSMTRIASIRKTHESTTLGALRVLESDTPDRQGFITEEYKSLAGSTDRLADFISWFSQVSTNFFAHRDGYARKVVGGSDRAEGGTGDPRRPYLNVHKLGLELGGVCLIADWDAGNILDDAIREIPDQAERSLGLNLDVINGADNANVYRLEPLQEDGFVLIRRRRAIADFKSDFGGSQVQLFKETTGLLILKYLDERSRTLIQYGIDGDKRRKTLGMGAVNSFNKGGGNNSQASTAGGGVFHRVIKDSENRDKNTEVIPLSSHYVAVTSDK